MLTEQQGGSTTQRYLLGSNRLMKYGEAPQLDGLGSMRQGINTSSGNFTGQADYSAFGELIGGANTTGFQSVYQWGAQSGYRADGASGGGGDGGLLKVGARYYDPAVGRFTSRDTNLSQAPYAYCDGDPINATDPTGHSPGGVVGAVIGALIFSLVATTILAGVFLSAPVTIAAAIIGALAVVAIGIIYGAIGGALGGSIGEVVTGHEPTETTVAEDGIIGAVIGLYVGVFRGMGGAGGGDDGPLPPRELPPVGDDVWPPPPLSGKSIYDPWQDPVWRGKNW